MQNANLYRQIAAACLDCARDSKTASERDGHLAGAIRYQQLARALEDGDNGCEGIGGGSAA